MDSIVHFDPIDYPQFAAPGQHLGYSLQTTRFLMQLLDADPEWIISLEAFEDVGVETPDGDKIAEQDKSALSHNPISNRAKDLWKTFANWIDAVKSGFLDPERTIFEIYISRQKSGEIAESFSEAKSIEAAEAALKKAEIELWGKAPKYPLQSSVSTSISKYVTKVLETDRSLVSKIIRNFNLRFPDKSPIDDLKTRIKKALVPEEQKDDFTHFALGWVKEKTDSLIENGEVAAIQGKVFQKTMISFIRTHDNKTILETYAYQPAKDQIEKDLKLATYIRQLELIDIVEHDEKIRAVIDKLRASVHRSNWSAKGLVLENSFDEFGDVLIRAWNNLKRKTKIRLSSNPNVEKGQYLYSECLLVKAKIAGLEVPAHFIPGSYHSLSDNKVLGWHPHYEKKLDGKKDEDG
ncbi:MAG: hypothetical protein GY795_17860 [Desulfobacterales bacterium]|nr:hypothetical protein [Desulfobacterales bacterium]